MVNNYFQTAKDNEAVFRNILSDLKNNREQRPMGFFVPEDIETEADLEVIFEMYSSGNRFGKFTINDFQVDGSLAIIAFEDIAALSGGGASLRYLIKNSSVEYLESASITMS